VWLRAIETSALATAIRQSPWIYPSLEIVHIVGFVVLVGSAMMFDLRLLGLSRELPVDRMATHLLRWSRASLLLVVPSGLLLFMSAATETWAKPAFRIKLVLIGCAGFNAYIFHRWPFTTVSEWNHRTEPPMARTAAIASLVLWVSVIAAGRMIAYW
jgi:uncharacterized membrane-anchored protein